MSPQERTAPGTASRSGSQVIAATETSVPQTTVVTPDRLAERLQRLRRQREYRRQVRRVLQRNRAAGLAMRHSAKLARLEPVGHLSPSEVDCD